MDFFARQEQAHRKTKLLAAYLSLAVGLLVGAIYLVLAAFFLRPEGDPLESLHWLWDFKLFLAVAAGVLLIILIGSLSKIFELRQGGRAVATSLGGQPLNPHTDDLDERKLLNVVEEMAIASGIPVPAIYVLPEERGINAFAAGYSPSDAVVGVTRGSVKLLNRDELQGVIAHEFSHILNGDMRLNLRLIGIVSGILCIALLGRMILRVGFNSSSRSSGSREKKGGNPFPLIGLALVVIGYLGVLFGRLIKSAISRQREFLADAAAVQFTRNPGGLAGALKKIGGLRHGSRLLTPQAEEASHLFFGNALAESWFQLLSTHPPLVERIRLLDPAFDGHFPIVQAPEETRIEAPQRPPLVSPKFAPMPALSAVPSDLPSNGVPAGTGLRPAQVLPHLGAPTPDHLVYAAGLISALPGTITQAAREPFGACALIYSLLLSPNPVLRAAQLQSLQAQIPPPIFQEMSRLGPSVSRLGASAKLPLTELALTALRGLSPEQYARFTQTVQFIIEFDRQIDLFEYTLQKILRRHLAPHFHPGPPPIVQFYTLKPLLPDSAVLLSALAHVGQENPAQAEAAFRLGTDQLGVISGGLKLLEFTNCDLPQIDAALDRLAQAAPALKKRLLNACAYTVAADGVIQEREAELLRAIAEALDCPAPPIVPSKG